MSTTPRPRATNGRTDGTGAQERITVSLIAKASDELRNLQDRTGLSKTDIVNRAISLYEFVEAAVAAGDELVIMHGNGELHRIKLL